MVEGLSVEKILPTWVLVWISFEADDFFLWACSYEYDASVEAHLPLDKLLEIDPLFATSLLVEEEEPLPLKELMELDPFFVTGLE